MEKKGKTREEVWKQNEEMQEGQIGEVQNEGEINEWEVGAKRQEEGERKTERQGEKDYSQHLWANFLRLLTRILPFLNLGGSDLNISLSRFGRDLNLWP